MTNWSSSPETPNSDQNCRFFGPCDQIWWMTLKNNRAPLICLYATPSFVHHSVVICQLKLELQYGNAQCGSKSSIFRTLWPWNLTDDLEQQKRTSSMPLQALCIILKPFVNSNKCYNLETPKLGQNLFQPLWQRLLTLTFCTDITFVNSKNSWKFHDAMTGTCDRQMDRLRLRSIHRAACLQLKISTTDLHQRYSRNIVEICWVCSIEQA